MRTAYRLYIAIAAPATAWYLFEAAVRGASGAPGEALLPLLYGVLGGASLLASRARLQATRQ